jgi:iron complex transport system permease protein
MSPDSDDLPRVSARSLILIAVWGLLATLAVAAACCMVGQLHFRDQLVSHRVWDIWAWPLWTDPVMQIRPGRLIVAALVGAALAAAGMALQGLLRNPLAEPYILGISSGAGVGVLVGPLAAGAVGSLVGKLPGPQAAGAIGMSIFLTAPALALAGALLTCLVVYGIAQRRGRLDPYVLLLSGVIVSVFNSAIMMAVMLVSNRNEVLKFIGWGMGGIPDGTDGSLLMLCAPCILLGWLALLLRGAAFNTLGLGDGVAASLGVPIHWLRVETFAIVGLMTAAAVSLAGPIGFVGLIVPHICRLIVGADHRRLVLVSGFVGAIMLMLADTLGRTVGPYISVGSIPVGIITAMAGGPFFIFMLRRRFKEGVQ